MGKCKRAMKLNSVWVSLPKQATKNCYPFHSIKISYAATTVHDVGTLPRMNEYVWHPG